MRQFWCHLPWFWRQWIPQVTLIDSYHEEHYWIDEIDDNDPEEPETDDIVILSYEDIKKSSK